MVGVWLHRQILICICLDCLTEAHTPTLFHSARTHPETQEIVQVLMVVNHHRHQLIFCICVTALASTAGVTGQSCQLSQ